MPREERFWIEYIVAFVASITAAGYGCVNSWTSPALPFLKKGKSNLSLVKEEITWIAPLLSVGIIIGNFINPIFINRIGRKWTLLLFAVPQIVSWFFILLAKNSKIICIGRILGGIGYGGGICATIVYLSEIGNCKNRGIFLTFIKISSSFGIFFTNLLGAFLSYFYMNLCLLMMPIIFVIVFPFMPDSSYFFEKNKKTEDNRLVSLEEKLKLINETKALNCNRFEIETNKGKRDWKELDGNLKYREEINLKNDTLRMDSHLKNDELESNFGWKKNCELKNNEKLKKDAVDLTIDDKSKKEGDLNNDNNLKEDFNLKGNDKLKENSKLKTNNEQDLELKNCNKRDSVKDYKKQNESKPCEKRNSFKEDNFQEDKLNEDKLNEENFKGQQFREANFKSQNNFKDDKDFNQETKNVNSWKLITIERNMKALFIVYIVTALDCFSGHPVLITFSQQLLTYEGSLLSPEKGALIVVTTKLVASVVASQVIERFRRKSILLSTGILVTLTLAILTIFFYLEHYQLRFSFMAPVPYIAFLIFETASTIGASNLFYVLQGELFENNVKGLAVTISKILHMFMIFLAIVIYQSLIEFFHTYVIFSIFTICSVILGIICLIVVPETKGKCLDEIQILLQKRRLFF